MSLDIIEKFVSNQFNIANNIRDNIVIGGQVFGFEPVPRGFDAWQSNTHDQGSIGIPVFSDSRVVYILLSEQPNERLQLERATDLLIDNLFQPLID